MIRPNRPNQANSLQRSAACASFPRVGHKRAWPQHHLLACRRHWLERLHSYAVLAPVGGLGSRANAYPDQSELQCLLTIRTAGLVLDQGGWGLAPPKSLPDPGPATIGLSRRLCRESLEFVGLGKPDDPAGPQRPVTFGSFWLQGGLPP